MLVDELLTYLFDEQPHLLAAPLATWLTASRRFATFATDFRTKIRKKLRATQEIESLLDLRLELETAYLLLQERSFSLVYEPQRGGQSRGPDFAVTFTTSMLFMVEVTRLRLAQDSPRDPATAQEPAPFLPPAPARLLAEERLAELVCSKLSQLSSQRSNVLLVEVEGPRLTSDTLRAAMIHLQRRAERNMRFCSITSRDRDFFNHQRLSELVRWFSAGEPLICGSIHRRNIRYPAKSEPPFTAATASNAYRPATQWSEPGADPDFGNPCIDNCRLPEWLRFIGDGSDDAKDLAGTVGW
jgi:hypothetical protein